MMETVYVITTLVSENNTVVAPEGISGSQYLSALIGVVLPIVVALVTKHTQSAQLKSLLLLALSTLSGFLTEMLNDDAFVWEQALYGAVITFVIGVATLFGLWRPTGVDNAAKNVLVHD
jgi:Na+/H+-translocating membrane pyrophosphatase